MPGRFVGGGVAQGFLGSIADFAGNDGHLGMCGQGRFAHAVAGIDQGGTAQAVRPGQRLQVAPAAAVDPAGIEMPVLPNKLV